MNLKKILSLSLGLVVLASVAVLTGTGTVGASPHINSVIAAPARQHPGYGDQHPSAGECRDAERQH